MLWRSLTGVALCLRIALARFRDVDAEARAVARGPALVVAAGVLLGAVLIGSGGGSRDAALAIHPE